MRSIFLFVTLIIYQMATAQQIFKEGSNTPLYSIFDNQSYLGIGTEGSGRYHLTIRDGNRICQGETLESLATFRDNKWLYIGDGYVVAYTIRDNSSYLSICKEESYDSEFTVRDYNSYWAICAGDSQNPEYRIVGNNVRPIEIFALMLAVGLISIN